MTHKETWFIILEKDNKRGIGECGILRSLSIDDTPEYEARLKWTCDNIHLSLKSLLESLTEYPSIQFGLEMAFMSLDSQDSFTLFPSDFTQGNDSIPINGLIWMGEKSFMKNQVQQKIEEGFSCLKLKIGAIDFDEELELLGAIRKQFTKNDMELRVDANGAFSRLDALDKLKRLSELDLHSIEQPIKQGQWQEMAQLCEQTPLPIALDEELIGVFDFAEKDRLLDTIKPQYIILKPSLVGGFDSTNNWIALAEQQDIGWWITSALESNVGLNAIAQYTYTKHNAMPQGLGTGSLFTNNFQSPLLVKNGTLRIDNKTNWKFDLT